jgi:hypothetical protein
MRISDTRVARDLPRKRLPGVALGVLVDDLAVGADAFLDRPLPARPACPYRKREEHCCKPDSPDHDRLHSHEDDYPRPQAFGKSIAQAVRVSCPPVAG